MMEDEVMACPRTRPRGPLVLALLALALAGCNVRIRTSPGQAAPVSGLLDAEGWEVWFSDDFDRAEVGERWEPTIGRWSIEDGALKGTLTKGSGAQANMHLADILLRERSLPETVEVRYESWSPDEVGSEAKLLDAEAGRGLIMALYGTPHPALASKAAAIFLQESAGRFGIAVADRKFAFEPEDRHKVRIVRQPEGVTIFVDGKQVASGAVGGRPESREGHLHLVGTFGGEGSVVYFDRLEIRVPPAEKGTRK